MIELICKCSHLVVIPPTTVWLVQYLGHCSREPFYIMRCCTQSLFLAGLIEKQPFWMRNRLKWYLEVRLSEDKQLKSGTEVNGSCRVLGAFWKIQT